MLFLRHHRTKEDVGRSNLPSRRQGIRRSNEAAADYISHSIKSPINQSVMTYLVFPIYGGAHLVVWKEHFPSSIERILWIASALSIGVLPFLDNAWGSLFPWIKAWFRNKRVGQWSSHQYVGRFNRRLSFFLCVLLTDLAFICRGLARAYLVVESFASLRSLPLGSYNAVSWVSLIPHF